jgi:hypothetical protein
LFKSSSVDYAIGLELSHCAWIGWILIDIDDSWHHVFVPQRPSKEPLGSRGIPPIRQQKVDGLPSGIYRSVKEPISSFDADVGSSNLQLRFVRFKCGGQRPSISGP